LPTRLPGRLPSPATSQWSGLGHDEQAAWGTRQGGAREPYLTEVALGDGASRCSCPSRRVPCKHALGLLALLADGAVPEGSPPERVSDWLAARKRSPAGLRKQAPVSRTPVDPQSAARRAASRDAKVTAGAAELDRWLADLVRTGLGAAQSRPWSWWDQQARRMIDAQARGLAGQVKRMAATAATAGHRADWPDRLTDQVGSAHLLCAAWPRRDALDRATGDALRVRLGYSVPADEVAASGRRVSDTWSVLGERASDDGNLRSLQQWLYGERDGDVVSFLSFGAGGQPPPAGLPPGRRTWATLALYPGTQPPRALIIERRDDSAPLGAMTDAANWKAALDRAARWLAADPWADVLPLAVADLTVLPGAWLLRDRTGRAMPLAGADQVRWALLALSGGHRVDVAGEWDGFWFTPQAAGPAGQPAQLLTGWRTGWPTVGGAGRWPG
jgi:SWIM zinc finger